jgi:hypothetical protein
MFSLIWKAIVGGNPASWAILGLGVLLAGGVVFGAGYATGAQSTVKTVATVMQAAPAKAAKEQKKADDKEADRGRAAGKGKDGRDARAKDNLAAVSGALNSIPDLDKCVVPASAIAELNKAGQTQ